MKLNFFNKSVLAILFVVATFTAQAAVLKGVVVDGKTKEPLIGATIIVENTTIGSVTGVDGDFTFDLPNGPHKLEVSYVSYKTQVLEVTVADNMPQLNIVLEPNELEVGEVEVIGRKNLENQLALQTERKASTVAIENIGAKEMSLKGISNAEEGVTKMTGISVASAGQVVVRGLGDRYSLTTLNGQPIASPNPDNKLIPLDIFPSSAIKNITVSKVYQPTTYADYSGAHIDITTKDQRSGEFFSVGFSVGGNFNTVGKEFFRMDHGSLFSQSKVDPQAISLSLQDYREYVVDNNIFDTDFSVESKTALPVFGGSLGYGNTFDVGNQKLSMLLTGGISNDQEATLDNEYRIIEATGATSDEYTYDNYKTELKMAALANFGLTLRDNDNISYTMFYARNAQEDYQNREGDTDNQGHIFSSNSVTHIYKLLTNQLHGFHSLNSGWKLGWDATYTTTASDEPDRRQVMFTDAPSENGDLILFTNDQQATMRYFGALKENELNGNIHTDYNFGEAHTLTLGASYKNKDREYSASRFYYKDLYSVYDQVDGSNMYNTNGYLNFENIASEVISIDRMQQPQDTYTADNQIIAGYAALDLSFNEDILLNLGLRYEHSTQTVYYYDTKYDSRTLKTADFFPAMNLKYNFVEDQQIRLAFSRTVTRPSFIEMAPFLYQESYGSAQIVGNGDLQNGYNYNLDLRYEAFLDGDMFSATVYYKRLQDPIERVQEKKGGATQQTFMNADNGVAAGVEIEFRKTFAKVLTLGLNGSFMYTDVKLSDGGVYTNKERQLQGASPYLFNADIAYTPKFGDYKQLSVALLYNLQGPRIHAVGIQGNGDVVQDAYNKLNFVTSYQLNKSLTLKLELSNLLNEEESFRQEIPTTGEKVLVERHKLGMGGSVGVDFKF